MKTERRVTIPDDLYDELVRVADHYSTTPVVVFRRFLRFGFLMYEAEKTAPDGIGVQLWLNDAFTPITFRGE